MKLREEGEDQVAARIPVKMTWQEEVQMGQRSLAERKPVQGEVRMELHTLATAERMHVLEVVLMAPHTLVISGKSRELGEAQEELHTAAAEKSHEPEEVLEEPYTAVPPP